MATFKELTREQGIAQIKHKHDTHRQNIEKSTHADEYDVCIILIDKGFSESDSKRLSQLYRHDGTLYQIHNILKNPIDFKSLPVDQIFNIRNYINLDENVLSSLIQFKPESNVKTGEFEALLCIVFNECQMSFSESHGDLILYGSEGVEVKSNKTGTAARISCTSIPKSGDSFKKTFKEQLGNYIGKQNTELLIEYQINEIVKSKDKQDKDSIKSAIDCAYNFTRGNMLTEKVTRYAVQKGFKLSRTDCANIYKESFQSFCPKGDYSWINEDYFSKNLTLNNKKFKLDLFQHDIKLYKETSNFKHFILTNRDGMVLIVEDLDILIANPYITIVPASFSSHGATQGINTAIGLKTPKHLLK